MSRVVFCCWSFSSDLKWLFLIKLSHFILNSVKRMPPISPGFGRGAGKSEVGGEGEKKGVDDLDISVFFNFLYKIVFMYFLRN